MVKTVLKSRSKIYLISKEGTRKERYFKHTALLNHRILGVSIFIFREDKVSIDFKEKKSVKEWIASSRIYSDEQNSLLVDFN